MDIWEEVKRFTLMNPSITVFGVVTIIQIVPIRIDPWTCLLKWIGSVVTGPLRMQIDELECKIDLTRKMAEEHRAEEMRWDIRIFTDSCKHGEYHSKEEWRRIIAQLERYEAHVIKHSISNGVIKEETKYLRKQYEKRNSKNDF